MPRFALVVFMAFAAAFAGVFLARHGIPTGVATAPIGELRPTLTSRFGDQTPEDYDRKKFEIWKEAEAQKNPELDVMRRALLKAANAYESSPCDKTTKAKLIVALTAYTRAWQATLDCRVKMFCNEKNFRNAQVAFSTSADDRIKEALDAAFEQRGVLKSEFPADVRFDMLHFAGSNLWGDSENAVCLPLLRSAAGVR